MNSKSLYIIIAVIAVGGGIFAVKNLKTTTAVDDPAANTAAHQSDTSDENASSGDGGARVGSIGSRTEGAQPRRSLSDRTIRRGTSAAALDVTPATSSTASHTPMQVAQTPQTSEDVREENRSIADLTNMFKNQADADARIDIAEKLGLIDSPESIRSALELLRDEKDPAVQEALLEAMQGLEAQDEMADEIFRAVSDIYTKTDNPDVKVAAQDLMGDLATKNAAAGLRQVLQSGGDVDNVKINAAENMLRIGHNDNTVVSAEETAGISKLLKDQYNSGGEAGTRQQIIMALATEGKQNAEFFAKALESEQDQQNREMLQRLVRMFTAPPPATPPPGTVVTPVPTLAPTPQT